MKATRAQISAELEKQAAKAKFPWPVEYDRAEPLFALTTMDDLSAQEWQDSHHVDLDFISAG